MRMKRITALLMTVILMLSFMPVMVLAAENIVTLTLSKSSAQKGETVTARGQADPMTFVSVKGLDGESIVIYDAVKSSAQGSYSLDFVIPDSVKGNELTIVAGYGEKVAVQTLTITELGSGEGGGGTTIPTPAVPALTADSDNNTVGQDLILSFTDNSNWRAAISDVQVNGASIAGQYAVAAGEITIKGSVFPKEGTYSIVVKANGYSDATVSQTIKAGILAAAPSLTAALENNIVGKDIILNFTDNSKWRAAVSDVQVNGASITGQYSVAAGVLMIKGAVFTQAGIYTVMVKATGYADTSVAQTILGKTSDLPPVQIGGDNTSYNNAALENLEKATEEQQTGAQLPEGTPALDPAAQNPVTLTAPDGVRVIVPAGALTGSIPSQLTIKLGSVISAPKAERSAVVLNPLQYQRQFGMAGKEEGSVTFNNPVTLIFPVNFADLPAGITVDQLAIYWWNLDKEDWVKLGGVYDPDQNTLSVTTYHFSTYAVMADTSQTAERIAGYERYDTAVAAAEAGWKSGADNAVIVNAYAYSDALAATPLAYKQNAPILLTDAKSLTTATEAELKKLGVKKITLIGGTAVISQGIEDQLKKEYGTANVIRYGGYELYDTAALIAQAIGTTGKAILVNGGAKSYTDALSIAGYAAYNGIPILFTQTDALPAATSTALSKQKVKETIVVGGTAVVSAKIANQLPGVTRYGGYDLYETATLVAKGLKLSSSQVYVATGLNFADALIAGNLAARTLSPIVLVDKGVPTATQNYLSQNKGNIADLTIVGGEAIITPVQSTLLRGALK